MAFNREPQKRLKGNKADRGEEKRGPWRHPGSNSNNGPFCRGVIATGEVGGERECERKGANRGTRCCGRRRREGIASWK